MKKAIVYTVLPALLMTLAAGCGTANGDQRLPSASPVISASPASTKSTVISASAWLSSRAE